MAVNHKELVTARLPRNQMDEVRRIAQAESESLSHVIRRLIRTALAEQRQAATK